jgi:hypothetical protein
VVRLLVDLVLLAGAEEVWMALFGWGRPKERAAQQSAEDAAFGNLFDPAAILGVLDQVVPRYLDSVDRHELIYPACKRTLTDTEGNVRSIWAHTRLEAMRYVMMVPKRDAELLIGPNRQPEMIEAFLRQKPYENTVVDFTGVPADDHVIAIVAGFNWLYHCASLAGVHPDKFARPLRNFRKIVLLAQQWWAMEGAGPRCSQMLVQRQKPPLMLYLIWTEYTRLAKEVASAAIYGSSIERATERDREHFGRELADRPDELRGALAALSDTMSRLELAQEPDDLLAR